MSSEGGLLVELLYAVSLVMSVLSYTSMDPMKSALYLVGSLVFLLPFLTQGLHSWYSYYICLLFLSGIFVVIVYFSSMSSFVMYEYGGLVLSVVVVLLVWWVVEGGKVGCESLSGGLGLMVVDEYFYIYFWLVCVMLIYLGFMSYFLTFEGALRKI